MHFSYEISVGMLDSHYCSTVIGLIRIKKSKKTSSRRQIPKLFRNFAFSQNFHTRELGEIAVFFAVKIIDSASNQHRKLFKKYRKPRKHETIFKKLYQKFKEASSKGLKCQKCRFCGCIPKRMF